MVLLTKSTPHPETPPAPTCHFPPFYVPPLAKGQCEPGKTRQIHASAPGFLGDNPINEKGRSLCDLRPLEFGI
jgi:hypothetical protein